MDRGDAEGGPGPIPPELKRFVWDIQSMVELAESEREILMIGRDLTARLLASAGWLPAAFSAAQPGAGRQFHVYRDAMERFCVVSTILAEGAGLTVTQTGCWEIMGVVAGAIERGPPGQANRHLEAGAVELQRSGAVDALRIVHARGDHPSLAIHVYGGAIGALSRMTIVADGTAKGAPLGYANPEGAPPYDIFSIQTEIVD